MAADIAEASIRSPNRTTNTNVKNLAPAAVAGVLSEILSPGGRRKNRQFARPQVEEAAGAISSGGGLMMAAAAAAKMRRRGGGLDTERDITSPRTPATRKIKSPKRRTGRRISLGHFHEEISTGSSGSTAETLFSDGDLDEKPKPKQDDDGRGGLTANWNVAARNFAVALVQKLERHMEALQQEVSKLPFLTPFVFVMLLADYLDVIALHPQHHTLPDDDDYDPTLLALEAGQGGGGGGRVETLLERKTPSFIQSKRKSITERQRAAGGLPKVPSGSVSTHPRIPPAPSLTPAAGGGPRSPRMPVLNNTMPRQNSALHLGLHREPSGIAVTKVASATALGTGLSPATRSLVNERKRSRGLSMRMRGGSMRMSQRGSGINLGGPQMRHQLYAKAVNRHLLATAEGEWLKDKIQRWEASMKYKWDKVATGEVEAPSDFFESRNALEFSLWQLFKAVDHSRSKQIKWDMLVSYLIDSTMKGRAGAVSQDDIKNYTMVRSSECAALYKMQKIRFLPSIHPPAYVAWVKDNREGRRDAIRLVSDTTFEVLQGCNHEIPPEHGVVVCFEYVPQYGSLAVSTADTWVRFYDMHSPSQNSQAKMMKKCGVSATTLRWNDRFGLMYVGLRTGGLQNWSISNLDRVTTYNAKPPEPVVMHEASPAPHSDAITDMIFLPFDGNLVTCSLDATIKCLHNKTGQVIKTFTGHQRGVLCISYSQQYNLLVSSGVEYNPLAWVINVPNSRPFTLRDGSKPHTASLTGVYHVPATAQCISVDQNGMIKVWDVRTLQCVQTICCEPNASKEELRALRWTAFEYHPGHKQIVTAAKRLAYVLEYNVQGRSVDPSSAMDYPIADAVHSGTLHSFITCAKRDIKVWDESTGLVTMSFDEISKDDIRCLDIDPSATKLYVGCFDGSVRSFTASTGSLVSEVMLPSACECQNVCAVPGTTPQLLLCVTTDGVVTLLKDAQGELVPLPFMLAGGRLARLDAKTICVDENLNVFLIGEGRNTVSVWDATPVTHGMAGANWRMLHECANSPQNCEVSCVITLWPRPAFVAADNSGGLHCWSLNAQDVLHPYTCMARWVNNNVCKGGYTPTVTAMAFHDGLNLLYCGDDNGMVNVYSLYEAFSEHLRSYAQAKPKSAGTGTLAVPETYGRRVSTPSATLAGQRLPGGAEKYGLRKAQTTTARLVRFWRAHGEVPVVSVQALKRPWAIVTGGQDCQVLIWSLWGEKICCLAKVRTENFPWTYQSRDPDPDSHNDVPWPHNPKAPKPQAQQGLAAAINMMRPLRKGNVAATAFRKKRSSQSPATSPRAGNSKKSPKGRLKKEVENMLNTLGSFVTPRNLVKRESPSNSPGAIQGVLAGRRSDSISEYRYGPRRGSGRSLASRAGSMNEGGMRRSPETGRRGSFGRGGGQSPEARRGSFSRSPPYERRGSMSQSPEAALRRAGSRSGDGLSPILLRSNSQKRRGSRGSFKGLKGLARFGQAKEVEMEGSDSDATEMSRMSQQTGASEETCRVGSVLGQSDSAAFGGGWFGFVVSDNPNYDGGDINTHDLPGLSDVRRVVAGASTSGASPQLLRGLVNSVAGRCKTIEHDYDYGEMLGQFDLFHKQARDLQSMLYRRAHKQSTNPTHGAVFAPAPFQPTSLRSPKSHREKNAPPLLSAQRHKQNRSPRRPLSPEAPISPISEGVLSDFIERMATEVLSEDYGHTFPASPVSSPASPKGPPPEAHLHLAGRENLRRFIAGQYAYESRSRDATRSRPPPSESSGGLSVPLSGTVVSRGVCPNLQTRKGCWTRARRTPTAALPKVRPESVAKKRRFHLPQLRVLSSLLDRPLTPADIQIRAASRASSRPLASRGSSRPAPESDSGFSSTLGFDNSARWLGWSQGDGIAVRRLQGMPIQKSWSVS
eukprot:Hpha_TRINITY_DN9341_c0_g1::TRINITY_DN9341_c0_g1_i1::g.26088::m.26088